MTENQRQAVSAEQALWLGVLLFVKRDIAIGSRLERKAAIEYITTKYRPVKQVSKSPPSWTYYNTTDFEYVCGLASLDPESVRREFLNCREYTPTEQPESWVEVFYE